MVTRSAIVLMGMLAVSLTLTGCRNCSSWGCKDGSCETTAHGRKLPPICDGTSCSHQGHTAAPTPMPKPTPPPAQTKTWYNPPSQTQINTPAVSDMRIPQAPVHPAPIATSPPAHPATAGSTVRTTASPASAATESSSAVTPASGTQPMPLRTWPGAESESAVESRPMPAMPERTGADMNTPAAAPAPIATSPASTMPMPARPATLPPATEPTLRPMETSSMPNNPMMPAQPTQVETQYHEVPSSHRTPVETPAIEAQLPLSGPAVAPELPLAPAAETNHSPAPASENPLMLPPAEGR